MKNVTGAFLMILLCFSLTSYAQNSRETAKEEKAPGKAVQRSSRVAGRNTIHKKNKKPGKSYERYYDIKIKEFEDRMNAVALDKKKKERAMKKPQYSDPSYFGHKRKPKKRPPGKKKYCKECGLYH